VKITLREAIAEHPPLRDNLLAVHTLRDILRGSFDPQNIELDDEMLPAHAAVLWIYAYVLSCLAINEMALITVIRVFREPFLRMAEEWVAQLEDNPDCVLRPCLLALANRMFASLSSAPDWLDLHSGQTTTSRPTVFEGISYNLAYPVKLEWQHLLEQQNAQRAMQTNS